MSKFGRVYGTWGTIVAYLTTFSSFFLWGDIPFGLLFFNRFSFPCKLLVIGTVFVEAVRWLSAGTNKGLIDLILIILCVVYFKLGMSNHEKRKQTKKTRWIVIAVVLVIVGVNYFAVNIDGRVSGNYQYLLNSIRGAAEYNRESIIIKVFPLFSSASTYITDYLTQGYYGLSLGLEQPFIPMFGVGHSPFLIENIEQILNVDIAQFTYASRIDNSIWSAATNWHTAFLWIANDVSPYGVPIITFIIGYYFGFIVNHLFQNDLVMFPLFCIFMQMFFYFPMNNQIFASPFSYMGFVGLNLYIFLLKKRMIRHRIVIFKI